MTRSGFLLAALAVFTQPAFAQVTRADLKPGLVFTAIDQPDGGAPRTVSRIEPGVGLTLAPGESAHPRQDGGDEFTWRGHINILQPGKYRFDATLCGKVEVKVGGQVVLQTTSAGDAAEKKDGTDAELAAGIQPFEVTLRRTAKAVRLELFWRGPGFRTEPIPYFFFGHLPAQRPATFAADLQREHGRFLFEELSCVRCHKPTAADRMAKTLVERAGPDLTEIGKRVQPGWLDAWLADPHKLRPDTVMPRMFADDEAGKAERYAVVTYLTSLSGPPVEPKPIAVGQYSKSVSDGGKLYLTAGCAACHGDKVTQPPTRKKKDDPDEDVKPEQKPEDSAYALGTAGPQGFYLLGAVGSKFTVESLAKYLQNPLATNPHGRMPNMVLSGQEAQDLARFLCKQTDDAIPKGMPAAPENKAAAEWKALGKQLLVTKGCVNCHSVAPGGTAMAALVNAPPYSLLAKARGGHGCLAAKPDPERVPAYHLDAKQKSALIAFLKDGLLGPGSPAPAYQAKLALKRFNCLNCHNRDGEGGIAAELADQMKLLEKAENADDVSPPRLTGAGHKLRTPWFKQVLTSAGRARPWMTLRMPQYGEANIGFLADALPKLEGTIADEAIGKVAVTSEKIAAGRTLTGKSGHGCISCHDISGVSGGGTRGPDLALTDQRVRYDWYVRWMHHPQRIAPGTKMPQVALDGKSLLTSVYDGDADKQFEALWSYLALGPGLPLPAGMEPPKGLVIQVKDRPEILRTFMPDGAGTKAIAVGFPGGTSVVFDAATCRLGYAWSGNFLDASPVWNNRGGSPAKLLGPKFWTGPAGFPWAVTDSRTPPDFAKRATDPAFGHQLSNDALAPGPRLVHFAGYALDPAGVPTFRYALTTAEGKTELAVVEKVEPLPVTVAAGFRRKLTVDLPAGRTTWLLAGVAAREPRVTAVKGGVVDTAVGSRMVIPTDGGRATVIEVATAPAGAAWQVSGRQVQLRLPEGTGKAELVLNVWGLPRDDAELLKGLRAK